MDHVLGDIQTFRPFRHARSDYATASAYAAYAELLSTFGLASDSIRKALIGVSLSVWRRVRNAGYAPLPANVDAGNQEQQLIEQDDGVIEELDMPLHNHVRVRRVTGVQGNPWVAIRLDGRTYPSLNAKGGRCCTRNQLYSYIRSNLPDWESAQGSEL